MADINVERKRPSIWPWIIGLIVLSLLIWVLLEVLAAEEEEMLEEPATADTVAAIVLLPPLAVRPALNVHR